MMPIPDGLTGEGVVMWVIFDRPLDFPDHYVMRAQESASALGYVGIARARIACLADTIGELREPLIERGLYRLPRHPNDVASLVEVWL